MEILLKFSITLTFMTIQVFKKSIKVYKQNNNLDLKYAILY